MVPPLAPVVCSPTTESVRVYKTTRQTERTNGKTTEEIIDIAQELSIPIQGIHYDTEINRGEIPKNGRDPRRRPPERWIPDAKNKKKRGKYVPLNLTNTFGAETQMLLVF